MVCKPGLLMRVECAVVRKLRPSRGVYMHGCSMWKPLAGVTYQEPVLCKLGPVVLSGDHPMVHPSVLFRKAIQRQRRVREYC
eukprot:scaffold2927_cov408-Prasinococcus_capsulatus_cf.AAC.2